MNNQLFLSENFLIFYYDRLLQIPLHRSPAVNCKQIQPINVKSVRKPCLFQPAGRIIENAAQVSRINGRLPTRGGFRHSFVITYRKRAGGAFSHETCTAL